MSPQLFFLLESTLDRGTAARNEGNLDNPLQPPVNTPAAKRQSESGLNPTPPSLDRYVSFKIVKVIAQVRSGSQILKMVEIPNHKPNVLIMVTIRCIEQHVQQVPWRRGCHPQPDHYTVSRLLYYR